MHGTTWGDTAQKKHILGGDTAHTFLIGGTKTYTGRLGGGDAKLNRHENFSWDMRFSYETGDRRFSWWGGEPNTEKT